MLIYLAHPIDKNTRKYRTTLDQQVSYVRHLMKGKPHVLFHPGQAFVVGGGAKVDHTIETINRKAQETADAVLVLLPRGAKSWGVPAEIERARHLHQPVAIISDESPTWAMPTPQEPLVAWYKPDSGNYSKAIKFLEQNAGYTRPSPNVVKWQKLADTGRQPSRAYLDDAGLDVYVSKQTVIPPSQFVDIPTDIAVELPSDSWGMLTGRSSTTRKRGLLVNQGIIDTGYRGELYIGAWNLTNEPVTLYPGDRIAQLIIISNRTAEVQLIEKQMLSQHPRGTSGFGSTGD